MLVSKYKSEGILLNFIRTWASCHFSRIERKGNSFFGKSDISYCKTGRADTVYCVKSNSGDKIYKLKHLLWTMQDMVKLFNIENLLEKVSYYGSPANY